MLLLEFEFYFFLSFYVTSSKLIEKFNMILWINVVYRFEDHIEYEV